MLKIKDIILLGIVLLLAGCSGDGITTDNGLDGNGYDPVGKPVLFSVGLEGHAKTRSTSVMANGARFVCTMFYHAAVPASDAYDVKDPTAGGTMNTAWLEVSGDDGNAVYKNQSFTAEATSFYWQNRQAHAFLALADYNKLTTNDGSTTAQGKLKMYPYHDTSYNVSETTCYANTFDLTRGERSSMAQQPDPILALTTKTPTSEAPASQETNRVTLDFQHQFSQIQVNLKNEDTTVDMNKIDKVELVGVTTEGYVPTRINADGTAAAASFKVVSSDTSFKMFSMAAAAEGYTNSYNAIAFGSLVAIRVTWYEGTAEAKGVIHTPTLTLNAPITLASGKRYTYNLKLSRGSLNVISTSVVAWELSEFNMGLANKINE